MSDHAVEIFNVVLQFHQKRLQRLEHFVLPDIQERLEPVVPISQRIQKRDSCNAGLGNGQDNAEERRIFAAAVDGGRFDQFQRDRTFEKGPHDNDIEGTDQQRNDECGVILAQAEHLLRDDIRRDKTAAEKHDEEAEEVEEITVFEIRTVERVGIQDTNQGAQNRTDAGNEDAVEE